MNRKYLAIHGTENANGVPRLELVLDSNGRPELLHSAEDGAGGRFGRVFQAFVGAGRLPKPVAFKLERTELDPHVGRVKFLNEYNAQVSVHRNLKAGEKTHVVRLIEYWNSNGCDELPPTLICHSSKQIVAPRCPSCLSELNDNLRCGRRSCPKAPVDAIRAASGCAECRKADRSCVPAWLNQRKCKMLLLEQLDLDLADYISWRWPRSGEKPVGRAASTKFQEKHRPALNARAKRLGFHDDETASQYDELKFLLKLFQDAVKGVGELHACGIPHLDIKPANLCLNLDGESARLKVIDLGQADDPARPWGLRHQSIRDDAERKLRTTVYSAPEQLPQRIVPLKVCWQRSGDEWLFQDRSDRHAAASRSDVMAGDWFYFSGDDDDEQILRVTGVDHDHAKFTARLEAAGTQPAGSATRMRSNRQQRNEPRQVWVVQHAGFAADLFALGLLLIDLISRGRADMQRVRDAIVETPLSALPDASGLPARETIRQLIGDHRSSLGRVLADLLAGVESGQTDETSHTAVREVYEDLLGLALRATIRGVPDFSLTTWRGTPDTDLSEQLLECLLPVVNRLGLLSQTYDLHSGRVYRFRSRGLRKLKRWLAGQPDGLSRRDRVAYDRERICHTLDSLTGDRTGNEKEFRLLLSRYDGAAAWLKADLKLFGMELNDRLTVAAGLHPVVVNLMQCAFGTDSPSRQLMKLQQELTGTWAASHRSLNDVGEIIELLAIRRGQGDLTDETIAALTEQLETLDKSVRRIERRLNSLSNLLSDLSRHEHELINHWDRLHAASRDGPSLSHSFRLRLQRADEASRRWIDNTGKQLGHLRHLTSSTRISLVSAWPEMRRRFRRSLRGLVRRTHCWLRGSSPATRVTIAPPVIETLQKELASAQNALASQQSIPESLSARLSVYFQNRSATHE